MLPRMLRIVGLAVYNTGCKTLKQSPVGQLLATYVATPVALAVFRLHVVFQRFEPVTKSCHKLLCELMDFSAPLREYALGSWAAVAGRAWNFLMAHVQGRCDECLEAAVACLVGDSDMATALALLAMAEADLDHLIILHSMGDDNSMGGMKQMVTNVARHMVSIVLSGDLPKLVSDLLPVTMAVITKSLITALRPILIPLPAPMSYASYYAAFRGTSGSSGFQAHLHLRSSRPPMYWQNPPYTKAMSDENLRKMNRQHDLVNECRREMKRQHDLMNEYLWEMNKRQDDLVREKPYLRSGRLHVPPTTFPPQQAAGTSRAPHQEAEPSLSEAAPAHNNAQLFKMAKAAQDSGEQRLAYELYSQLTTMELSNKEEQYLAYHRRGGLAQRKGDHLQALYDLSIAASLKPTQWQPLMTRSKAYRALHHDSAAAEDLSKARQLGVPVNYEEMRYLQTSGNTVNPCLVLGVKGKGHVPCDPDHARRVWKRLLVKYHPDKKKFQEAKDSAHFVSSLLNSAVATFYDKRAD